MAELVSLREFARRREWNPGYAHKLKERGRLVMVDGKVDVEASNRLLEESADPARAHLRQSDPPPVDAPSPPASAAAGGTPLSHNATFNRARTASQVFDARLRELEYKERIGDLVPLREVEQLQFTAARITRDRLQQVAPRIAADLQALAVSLMPEAQRDAFAAALPVHEFEQRLDAALRDALNDAAKAIEDSRRDDDDPDSS